MKGTVIVQANSAGSVTPPSNRLGPFLSKLSGSLAPLLFLLLLSVALSFLTPHFAERDNFKKILIQAAVVAILACGQTAVIISGNIDLSVGAVMAFAGVAAAEAMSQAGTVPVKTLPLWMILILSLPIAILAGWAAMKIVRSLSPNVTTGTAMVLGLPILLCCISLAVLVMLSAGKMVGMGGKLGRFLLSVPWVVLTGWLAKSIRDRPQVVITLSVFLLVEAFSAWLLQHVMAQHGVNMWGGVAIACAGG